MNALLPILKHRYDKAVDNPVTGYFPTSESLTRGRISFLPVVIQAIDLMNLWLQENTILLGDGGHKPRGHSYLDYADVRGRSSMKGIAKNQEKIDLRDLFKKMSSVVRNESDLGGASSTDPGSKGRKREIIVRNFLSQNLPESVGVSEGQVFDLFGNASRQCDVIFYSKTCLTFRSPSLLWFPIDSVLGVGEVKSHLNRSDVEDCVDKIRAVKKMQIRRPNFIMGQFKERALGWIFAFSSTAPSTICRNLENSYKNQGVSQEEKIDLIYVHDKCVIAYSPFPLIDPEMPDGIRKMLEGDYVIYNSGKESLLLLVLMLVSEMNHPNNLRINMVPQNIGYPITRISGE